MNKRYGWLMLAGWLLAVPSYAADKAAKKADQEVEAAVNDYFVGENCPEVDVPHEIPFEEGKTPPRPCKGFFWTLITQPAVFKCVEEQVKTSEATFYMKPIPAKYEWVEEQIETAPARKLPISVPCEYKTEYQAIEVQPAYKQLCIKPAEFRDECETIVFRPASKKEVAIPAQYKTEMMTIEIEPERDLMCGMNTPTDLQLQCGEGVAGSIGASHQPAKCITIPIQKEVAPATTKTVNIPEIKKEVLVRKLVKPATVEEVEIPAVIKKVPVEVCVNEERIEFKDVPAEYQCVRRLELKTPATTQRVDVPAKFQLFRRNELVTPVKLVWRQYSISKCKAVADVCARYGCLPGSGAFKN